MHDDGSMSTRVQAPAPRQDLFAIVYVSTAARAVGLDELMRLLEGARRRNAQEGLTGVLLYADGRFMQYLEGPAAGLSRVYASIKHHPLHYGLIDLVRQPIQARAFADWAMAFHLVGAFGQAAPDAQDAALADRLLAARHPASAAHRLLAAFWREGRHSVPSALRRHSSAHLQRYPGDLDTGTHD
jgi:hypothetical protein